MKPLGGNRLRKPLPIAEFKDLTTDNDFNFYFQNYVFLDFTKDPTGLDDLEDLIDEEIDT